MKTVLLIDDDVYETERLGMLLALAGHNVVTASNGQEGLDRLEEVQPDVVLCDVLMPGLRGWDVAHAMQAHPDYRAIPLVLMSSYPEALSTAGVSCATVLSKPISLAAVLATLAQLTGA